MNTQPLTPPEPEQHDSVPTPPEPEQRGAAPIPPAPPAPEPSITAPPTPVSEQHTVASTPVAPRAAASKPTPRTSPIVWGSLILVFCAYVFVRTEGWSVDTTTWLITTIIGVGALLLVVGIAVLLRNSRQNR